MSGPSLACRLQIVRGKSGGSEVPQVASQTGSHPSTATHGPAYRSPAQQSERTSSSPFQSLLDETAAAAESRPSDAGSKVAHGQDTSKPAKTDAGNTTSTDKPQDAKAVNPGQTGQTGKAKKAVTPDMADLAEMADKAGKATQAANADKTNKADKAGKTEKTKDGDKGAAKDPAKATADAAPTAQVGDITKPATATPDPTAAVPAPVPPTPPVDAAAANILASALIPAGIAHTTPVQTPAAREQPAEATAVTADAPKSTPVTAAAFQVQTAKAGEAGKSSKTSAKDAADGPAKTDAAAGDDGDDAQAGTAGAQPKADAKDAQPTLTEADKQHIAGARGQTSADGKRAASADALAANQADANAAAAKADGVTLQGQTTPAHTAAATAQSAATPAQSAPQTATVPLAGLGVEIASKALDGTNHFAIRLDPPELGGIEVHLNVDKDGHVTSRLIADRSDTLDLLRRDSSGLDRALQDAGLKTSDNGMQFSLRDQTTGQQQQHQQQQQGAHRTTLVVPDDTLPVIDATQMPYGRSGIRAGGLDISV
jgi:flagellar hook-length control protein FliK